MAGPLCRCCFSSGSGNRNNGLPAEPIKQRRLTFNRLSQRLGKLDEWRVKRDAWIYYDDFILSDILFSVSPKTERDLPFLEEHN